MQETRLIGVRLKDGPVVMMRVPIETKSVKPVASKPPPVPRAIDRIAKAHDLPKDVGRWLFIFAHFGPEWLNPNKVSETSQLYTLWDRGLIKIVTTSTIVTHWSDGSVTKAGYFGPGSTGTTDLTGKGAALYVEMREAIAEGAT